ncbi:hypothetical protein GCM10010840_33280 [Deinococcus aerolatus]|uniref:Uncharacterized protein n=1 Tax=Deinococcus aerolatus TaxID=522487 RepID=A0ABQ2GEN0_9DEIO|nr:hypothetical protein GCM10010840_33280 [Deinococcus aerolatus]
MLNLNGVYAKAAPIPGRLGMWTRTQPDRCARPSSPDVSPASVPGFGPDKNCMATRDHVGYSRGLLTVTSSPKPGNEVITLQGGQPCAGQPPVYLPL